MVYAYTSKLYGICMHYHNVWVKTFEATPLSEAVAEKKFYNVQKGFESQTGSSFAWVLSPPASLL